MTIETSAAAILAQEPAAECRIYVACLASYNDGRLYGRWIDVDGKDADELGRAINAMLAGSPCPNVTRRRCNDCGHYQDVRAWAEDGGQCHECGSADLSAPFASAEEWAVHDHEGFGGWAMGEYPSLDDVAAVADILTDGDDAKARGFRFLLWNGYSVSGAIDKAEDVIMSEGPAVAAVESYYEETGQIDERPEWAQNHIDWESIARDWQAGGDLVAWEDPADGSAWCIMNSNSL